MSLEHDIEAIRTNLKADRYKNEADVSQGIVLRLLAALGWDIYDPQTVRSQHNVEGTFPDFALCHPGGKTIAFVEVKRLGESSGAEKQLFGYAVHMGVQFAILTTGQEWSFFLPGEPGDYDERRVYKLDIIERDTDECVRRLKRYLEYEAVISGRAIEAAKADHQDVARERQVRATLPRVWEQLISGEDESLQKLLSERVASLCGQTPDLETVASFLKANAVSGSAPQIAVVPARTSQARVPVSASVSPRPNQARASHGFELCGTYYPERNAKDVLVNVFKELTKRDPTFPERFVSFGKHGTKRRYLARTRDELYPGQPGLALRESVQLSSRWWIGTHYSNEQKVRIIQHACDVAGLRYGKDLRVELPNSSR